MIVKLSKETGGHSWSCSFYKCWTLSNNTKIYSCCISCPMKMTFNCWNIALHPRISTWFTTLGGVVGTLWDFNNVVMAIEIPSWELLWMLSPTFAWTSKGGVHKGCVELSHIRASEQFFMSMWNVKSTFIRYVWISIQLFFHKH